MRILAVLGVTVAAIGYGLAIRGTRAAAEGAPEPQLPGTVPVGVDRWVTDKDAEHFEQWKKRARSGHRDLVLGTRLQLLGTIIAGIAGLL